MMQAAAAAGYDLFKKGNLLHKHVFGFYDRPCKFLVLCSCFAT
jgi:hypothetical protein